MYCQSCGAEARSSFKFCPVCGNSKFGPGLHQPSPSLIPSGGRPNSGSGTQLTHSPTSIDVSAMQYAGFWRRAASLLLDMLFISILVIPVGFVFGLLGEDKLEGALLVLFWLSIIALVYLYYTLQESGPKQATWGKQIMGLVVSDMQGKKISFGKASARYFARGLSQLPLHLGYVLMLFTERKQTLHDKLSGSVVLYRGD